MNEAISKIEAVILDFDGLMVDTEPLQSQAWVRMLKKYDKTPELYDNGLVHKVGKSIEENWKILKKKYVIQKSVEVLEKERSKIYLELLKKAKPMEGLKKLLTRLYEEKNAGRIKLGMASHSRKEYVEFVIEKLGFKDYFDTIVVRKDVNEDKPAPDIYLETARKLKVTPEKCVVLEDSETGVKAGHEAGMKIIAVPNKYTKQDNFSEANLRIDSLKEIDMNKIYSLGKV
ncbi:HAD family phosphatase [Candidatus Woesearchaeota archaeon]|nr:HAD family phosphatase [Candidatus Woesearchaeota archaeon]